MKKIVGLFIVFVFLFSGCVQKQRVVHLKLPEQGFNKTNSYSNNLDVKNVNETPTEEITTLEPMEEKVVSTSNEDFKPLEAEEITDSSKIKNMENEAQEGQAIVEELPSSNDGVKKNENLSVNASVPQEGEALVEDLPATVAPSSNTDEFNIAVVYPSKLVAKYGNSSVNTVMGYMSFRKKSYKVRTIDSYDESPASIQKAFKEVKDLGITNVIALYTPNAKYNLSQADVTGLRIYLPLIDSKFSTLSTNFIYGSISYEAQVQKLLQFSNGNNTMFYQDSFLGNKLKNQVEIVSKNVSLAKQIKKNTNDFKYIVNDSKINNSTLFLNTDPVKTSILLSQLRAYNIKPHVVLSTQINYDFSMTKLTQIEDRSNFIVASSIGNINVELIDEISTFGGDVVFEWVDYSTLVGIDYLFDGNNSGLIDSKVEGNSAVYNTRLYKFNESGFTEIK